jgi:hypothetical protein
MWPTKKQPERQPQISSGKSQTQQKGAQPSGRSTQLGTLSGTTRLEHQAWTKNEKQHHALTETAAQAATQARDMLEKMTQPSEREGPSELQEMAEAIALILKKVTAIEARLNERPNGRA